MSDDVLLHQDV